jgi:hypothetical protein
VEGDGGRRGGGERKKGEQQVLGILFECKHGLRVIAEKCVQLGLNTDIHLSNTHPDNLAVFDMRQVLQWAHWNRTPS